MIPLIELWLQLSGLWIEIYIWSKNHTENGTSCFEYIEVENAISNPVLIYWVFHCKDYGGSYCINIDNIQIDATYSKPDKRSFYYIFDGSYVCALCVCVLILSLLWLKFRDWILGIQAFWNCSSSGSVCCRRHSYSRNQKCIIWTRSPFTKGKYYVVHYLKMGGWESHNEMMHN